MPTDVLVRRAEEAAVVGGQFGKEGEAVLPPVRSSRKMTTIWFMLPLLPLRVRGFFTKPSRKSVTLLPASPP